MGRGRAAKTNDLIDIIIEIAEATQPCSVRGIGYKLFTRKLIPSMHKDEIARVSRLTVIAREEGLLPWEWVVDSTREEQNVPTWADPEDYADFVQQVYRKDKWADQPKRLFTWSEKGTCEGLLQPVLRKHEVPFQIVHGWSGATAAMNAAQANLRRKQDTLILYVGDFDPSGMGMSELDLPKRLARYSSGDPSDKEISIQEAREILKEVRLEIRRIALMKAHTRRIGRAASFPATDKVKDPRYEWFVKSYGHTCWELDALDPNELRDCVEAAIVAELDQAAWNRYVQIEREERQAIIDVCSGWSNLGQQD
jgi:hypothetical protein